MARVPLVVVITIVRPEQMAGVQSPGELPRSNPSIGKPLTLARKQGRAGRQHSGDSAGLVDLAARDDGVAAGRQGMDHGRGRSEDVDHHRHASSKGPGRDQGGQEMDVHRRSERHRRCQPYLRRLLGLLASGAFDDDYGMTGGRLGSPHRPSGRFGELRLPRPGFWSRLSPTSQLCPPPGPDPCVE